MRSIFFLHSAQKIKVIIIVLETNFSRSLVVSRLWHEKLFLSNVRLMAKEEEIFSLSLTLLENKFQWRFFTRLHSSESNNSSWASSSLSRACLDLYVALNWEEGEAVFSNKHLKLPHIKETQRKRLSVVDEFASRRFMAA